MATVFDIPSAVWGVSLVDITCTGITRGSGKERNQQRNWETVLQTVGILTQPIVLELPKVHNFTGEDGFIHSSLYDKIGEKHKFQLQMMNPEINIWMFAIGSEHADVFGDDLDRLHQAFDMIPVIPELDNTIQLKPSVFHTQNPEYINIQFFPAPTKY
tara:strand:- start:974 stop:1447 length:474 start_codon:yes stop_codon:yes gene_type:complete